MTVDELRKALDDKAFDKDAQLTYKGAPFDFNELSIAPLVLDASIDTLILSHRTRNILLAANLLTIRAVVSMKWRDLRKLPNMGTKSMLELEELLSGIGLHIMKY